METKYRDRTFHFLIERSPTPIYERINLAFKNVLEELGHRVTYFDPTWLESEDKAIQYFLKNIASQKDIDYCLITSNSSLLYSYRQDSNCYLFELVSGKLIFIHRLTRTYFKLTFGLV